jgi:hypothetical protein
MQSRCVACGGQVETVPFGWCRPERSTAGQFALHYVRGQVPGATGDGEGDLVWAGPPPALGTGPAPRRAGRGGGGGSSPRLTSSQPQVIRDRGIATTIGPPDRYISPLTAQIRWRRISIKHLSEAEIVSLRF